MVMNSLAWVILVLGSYYQNAASTVSEKCAAGMPKYTSVAGAIQQEITTERERERERERESLRSCLNYLEKTWEGKYVEFYKKIQISNQACGISLAMQ